MGAGLLIMLIGAVWALRQSDQNRLLIGMTLSALGACLALLGLPEYLGVHVALMGIGIYSLAFKDRSHGIAVGGDYAVPDAAPDGAAYLRGREWTVSRTVPGAYRSGAAWLGHSQTALAVGPTGSDLSFDGGRTWKGFDTGTFDAVQCTADGSCWASGDLGRVAKLHWH